MFGTLASRKLGCCGTLVLIYALLQRSGTLHRELPILQPSCPLRRARADLSISLAAGMQPRQAFYLGMFWKEPHSKLQEPI